MPEKPQEIVKRTFKISGLPKGTKVTVTVKGEKVVEVST